MKFAGYRYLCLSVPTRNQEQHQFEWLVELFGTRPNFKKKNQNNKSVVNWSCKEFLWMYIFYNIFTSECSLAPINNAMCVSKRRRIFEEGDSVLSDTASVLRSTADPSMCPGWLKSTLSKQNVLQPIISKIKIWLT